MWNADADGNFSIYGGAMHPEPMPSDIVTRFLCLLPNDRVELIGVNWCRFGGVRHYGTDYRVQEVKVGGDDQWGSGSQLTNDSIGTSKLIHYGSANCYYLVSTQTVNSTFKDVAIRGNTNSAAISDWANTANIINSDEITSVSASTFGTNGLMYESPPLMLTAENESGTDIQSVNCRIVRILRAVGSGSYSTSTGSGALDIYYKSP